MITRNLINISNHPVLTDVTRKAQIFRSYKEYDTNRVILIVNIYHYKDDVELKYFPKQVELISDNEVKVNQQGEIVDNGTIGEFDYLWNVVNVQKQFTEVELEEIYVTLRQTKINEKLYGN